MAGAWKVVAETIFRHRPTAVPPNPDRPSLIPVSTTYCFCSNTAFSAVGFRSGSIRRDFWGSFAIALAQSDSSAFNISRDNSAPVGGRPNFVGYQLLLQFLTGQRR